MSKSHFYWLIFFFFPFGSSLPTLVKYNPKQEGKSIPVESVIYPAPVNKLDVETLLNNRPKLEFSGEMTREDLVKVIDEIASHLFLLENYTNNLLSQNRSMLFGWFEQKDYVFGRLTLKEMVYLVIDHLPNRLDRLQAFIKLKEERLTYVLKENAFIKVYNWLIVNLFILPALCFIFYEICKLTEKAEKITFAPLRWVCVIFLSFFTVLFQAPIKNILLNLYYDVSPVFLRFLRKMI